uniref:Pyridoxal-phosphate dependent enzyme n=1 Tax=Fervidicoccus fontis TaxID=683846 RepID=A0A7J3ZIW0_9CREN
MLYKCVRCGWRAPESPLYWSCPRCGGILELEYEKSATLPDARELLKCRMGVWCFKHQLPRFGLYPTLGEGFTPVLEVVVEGRRVALKLENLNPTGSFKDRGTPVAIASALKSGYKILCEDSSGNAGISTSCYARAYGLEPVIAVPKGISRGKLDVLSLCGAKILFGENREDARRRAVELWRSGSVLYIPHTHMPHHVEGMKTLAYEIFYQLSDMPTHVFVPTSSGSGLLGLYLGFKELKEWGYIDRIPKLIAVQSAHVFPLYRALKNRDPPIVESESLADGLALKSPPRLELMLKAIVDSKGDVVTVTNNMIRKHLKLLALRGILVEPTSAAGLAGFEAYVSASGEEPGSPLVVVTGSGLKLASTILELMP